MSNEPRTITIVSGLPRSGTSMMMKMLESGGLPILTDHIRKPNEDNPKGYYEFERVKKIKDDQDWLKDAKGKVVKMISALLKHLPADYNYKIIFMERKIEEILASQKKMLTRKNKPTGDIPDQKMAELYQKHLREVKAWLKEQDNMEVIDINYNQALKNPAEIIKKIEDFLPHNLDTSNMANTIDNSLYRQRR